MSPYLYMIFSSVFFAIMGAIVKYLDGIPFYELVLFRSLTILALCLPVIARLKADCLGKKENRKILLLRGIFGTAGLTLYFWTLQELEFGAAVTIQYTSPVFTILIGSYLYKHDRSLSTLLWAFVALVGVSWIYQVDAISADHLLPMGLGLVAAFFSGCAYTCISALGKKENSQVILMYFPLITIPATLIPASLNFVVPDQKELGLILAMGLSTYFAQYCLTKAYQLSKASKIAVFGNLNVIAALIVGTVLFNEALTSNKIFGAVLVGVSVYFVQKKTRSSQTSQSIKQTTLHTSPNKP